MRYKVYGSVNAFSVHFFDIVELFEKSLFSAKSLKYSLGVV